MVQGSETDTFTKQDACHPTSSTWVTEERKNSIRKGLSTLHNTVDHLLEHIAEPKIDKRVLQEIRIHMDHMDKQISTFHESIEHVAAKWTRILPKIETHEGDTLPMGLVLPVCMDGFVDGFLIGISSAVSLKAGIILSIANCLEMSFLGMAYASRLVKCTGSSKDAVNLALYGPPLLMLLASGLGAAIGASVQAIPIIFVAMVSFGAVALLFLVCNELLIEAREAQGDDEKWYISIMVFLGIYLVLMLDHII